MKDYTISESFTLPSKGLIYDKKFDPIITLHSMQTRHEMMRLSPGEYPYKSLCFRISMWTDIATKANSPQVTVVRSSAGAILVPLPARVL